MIFSQDWFVKKDVEGELVFELKNIQRVKQFIFLLSSSFSQS
jgi:hypothetical protein